MDETRYEVTVTADEETPVRQYLAEILAQLEGVSGIEDVSVDRFDQEERDISEVYRIISDLSDHELEQLEDAINSYTEGDE